MQEAIADSFTYNELLDFMRHCRQQGITQRSLHNILCVIRHYCNYLIHEGRRTDNPAAGVFIKGLVRKLPANLLSIEELEELYRQYSIQINVDRGKKDPVRFTGLPGCNSGRTGKDTAKRHTAQRRQNKDKRNPKDQ
ncbi:hypothetical protein [Paraflavitalea speifideaquila]|uniref:hypothetical protein n=1 Tax=Paraflavitalea speifideaquila TaxID=3076558 RepID=UPI0028E5D215|nr:hypothetical protein [Paraflavitalea speifideiaquila]